MALMGRFLGVFVLATAPVFLVTKLFAPGLALTGSALTSGEVVEEERLFLFLLLVGDPLVVLVAGVVTFSTFTAPDTLDASGC